MTPTQTETYLPLRQAAEKYHISEEFLRERVASGELTAAQLPDGEWLVSEREVDPSLTIMRADFAHLRGNKISVTGASRKYGVSHANFSRWAKAGYIAVLDRGYRSYLDEADVAYCAAVYQAKYRMYGGRLSGVSIFDQDGNPYQARNPEMAAYRRAIRREGRAAEEKDSSS